MVIEKQNLELRTIRFSGNIIEFLKSLEKNTINLPLINQVVRSATSVGANYHEASGSSSRKDFKNKIYICKKEIKETKYWLQVIAEANPKQKEQCRTLWQEAHELTLIFSKCILTLEENNKKNNL